MLTETTADLAWALILGAARRIGESERYLRAGKFTGWTMLTLLGADVHHKTLGVVGFGRIGQVVARRARGFAMRVLYTGPARASAETERETGAEYVDKATLRRTSVRRPSRRANGWPRWPPRTASHMQAGAGRARPSTNCPKNAREREAERAASQRVERLRTLIRRLRAQQSTLVLASLRTDSYRFRKMETDTMHWPLEQQGSTGENVRTVQYLLDAQGATLAVDGIFGPLTAAAVSAFQTANALVADGIVGDLTWPVLIVGVSSATSGDAVRAVQSQIHARSGWLTVNGTYDAQTESAVKFLQGDLGLTADGIVGRRTWLGLVDGYFTKQGAASALAFFDAWTHDDRAAAAKDGTPSAVAALFARRWHASDGWAFDGSTAAAGSFFCTWTRPGHSLVLRGNDNTGAPFYFVEDATFSP